MGIWNLGSVGDQVYNSVDNIPTNISGLLPSISNGAMIRVQNYTGQTIGSQSIAEKYQPAITFFAISDTLLRLSTQGADVDTITLGDFSINKGSSTQDQAQLYEQRAMKEMQLLGFGTRWSRTYGGYG